MSTWSDSPCIWRSWSCQLLSAELGPTDVVVDAVALERLPSSTTVVTVGAPFAIRVARDEMNAAALDALVGWAEDLEPVLIVGGRHDRRSWMCVSRRHDRLVLAGTGWSVRPSTARDERQSGASGHRPASGGSQPVRRPALIDAEGGE